jgi:uncharacterized coiled-coil protein SlyX
VGGGTGIVNDFLPDEEVTIVDMEERDIPGYVQADGTSLPFADDTFDVVVSADVLEHVPPEARERFLDESARVGKDVFILIAPFDNGLSPDFEKILYEFILAANGAEHQFLKEHITNGLPPRSIVHEYVKKKDYTAVSFPSGYLYHWLIIMMARSRFEGLSNSKDLVSEVETTYNKIFAEGDYREPAYRTVFLISKSGNGELLDRLAEPYKKAKQPTNEETKEMTRLVKMVYELYVADINNRSFELDKRVQELEAKTARDEITIEEIEKIVANRDEQIANYKAWLDEIHNKRVYKIYAGIGRLMKRGTQ